MSQHVDDYITMLADHVVLGQVNFAKLEQETFEQKVNEMRTSLLILKT